MYKNFSGFLSGWGPSLVFKHNRSYFQRVGSWAVPRLYALNNSPLSYSHQGRALPCGRWRPLSTTFSTYGLARVRRSASHSLRNMEGEGVLMMRCGNRGRCGNHWMNTIKSNVTLKQSIFIKIKCLKGENTHKNHVETQVKTCSQSGK